MPSAVAAVVVAAVGATGIAATAISFAVSAVFSLTFNAVLGALNKPKKPDQSSFAEFRSTGATQQFRQAVTERRIVYGEVRTSGVIVYPLVTDNNKYLHFVIVIASHEIQEIGEIIIDETSIPMDALDGDGMVTTGRYANLVRIKKHLGSPSQTADTDLIAASGGEWTSQHTLNEMAYIYVRYQWDRNVFPTGIPNISAWVKGKKCYDPRDATTKWTPNVGLITRDYLTDTRLGLGSDDSFIDETQAQATANTCEEIVTSASVNDSILSADSATNIITLMGVNDRLQFQTGDVVNVSGGSLPSGLSAATDYYVIAYQRKTTPRIKLAASLDDAFAGTAVTISGTGTGTITKVGEPRYLGGGILKTSAERGENLGEIITGMAGQVVYAGGYWRILAGEYQSPTIYLDENDIVGSINVSTKVSKTERFNRVQGVYSSPLFDDNPSDYPLVKNDTYATQDGEIIKKNIDLPFTTRAATAQRIAKIALERMRQEIIFEATFMLTAFKLQVGDNFYFSFDRYGWSNKIFEVVEWSLGSENGAPIVTMKCRENASAVYDWNNGEETTIDPAPNSSFTNIFDVTVVTGFSLDSTPVYTQSSDRVFNVTASWLPHEDEMVLSGGKYEIRYKETTESVYKSLGFFDGNVVEARITTLQLDVLYDVQIFAYNSLGVISAPTDIYNFTVGSTVTTNTEDWENETLSRDGSDWETDTLTSEDWES